MEAVNKKEIEINEGWGETALLLAGFIPVIGEVADTILIIKYAKEKRFIEAGLLVFALIPTVGDAIVKPILLIGKGMFRSSAKFLGFLGKNQKARGMFVGLEKYLNNPKLAQHIASLSKKSPAVGGLFTKLQKYISKLVQQAKLIEKRGLGKTMKRNFQSKALRNFRLKNPGVSPSTVLSKWWNVNYKGGRLRKRYINKLILVNGFLNTLGIYNIRDLEERMSNDKTAEELMNDPRFNEFVDQTQTVGDEPQTYQGEPQTREPEDKTGGLLGMLTTAGGGAALINVLKGLARFA